MTNFILPLEKISIHDIEIAGGKNASLGEMLQNLTALGIKIPTGFVITTLSYYEFIKYNGLEKKIAKILSGIDPRAFGSLREGGEHIRSCILEGEFPQQLQEEIINAYHLLSKGYQVEETDVAVRSSATAEDLPNASFAGQQETFLNVKGASSVLNAVRACFASLYTDRAISYRHNFGFGEKNIALSVCVQKMVRSDLGVSGVAFSIDTESGFRNAVVINASYGLGELLVQGMVSPDEYTVFKPLLKEGWPCILEKKLGTKEQYMIYGGKEERVQTVAVEKASRERFCMEDHTLLKLAGWVTLIEEYYSGLRGAHTPMDVEWGVDGVTQQLYILQARPETVQSKKDPTRISEFVITDPERMNKVLIRGIAVGDKIGCGKTVVIPGSGPLDPHLVFEEGSVLVTDMTNPDWEPLMKKASAIITNKGGRTCHAAIVARELGVPAIVGCEKATKMISSGETVTVSCAEGEEGIVYRGAIDHAINEFVTGALPKVNTRIMLNVASPSLAFRFSHLPHAGVGLAREEFIISNYIQVHPLALLRHRELNDVPLSREIKLRTAGYSSEEDFFTEKLASGIAKIAAAFYPHKVIVRFSDFKTNEYRNLLGGHYFEPSEENPMLGWRGASRYYSEIFRPAFILECEAIKKVREKMGLKNVAVMVPFCRTPEELLKVQEVMREGGLERGRNGLELYLMAEVPSNILLAEEFAKYIDGFSIGSNDLTQLTLGLDRDSSLVAHLYDERNPAVKKMLVMLAKTAKKAGIKIGICGQGPSDFPDLAQFLAGIGIDSISVTPDSVVRTIMAVHEAEEKKRQEKEQQVELIG
jgi:pyruvate,water dikinase